MEPCVFCRICSEERSGGVIASDQYVCAFHDINPKAPVHVLIVSKAHIPSVADLAPEHAPIIAAMVLMAKRIAAAQHLSGYKLVCNVGRDGGQVVDHLHLHLLGGWERPEDRRVSV